MVQGEYGRQLDGLRVGRLGLLLVGQLHPQFLNIVCDLRFVLQGVVDEEVVPNGVNVVDDGLHAVRS